MTKQSDVEPQILKSAAPLSKQTIAAFRILAREGKLMHSGQLAKRLGVDQHNVYRIMQPLVVRRMVRSGKISEHARRSYAAPPKIAAYIAYVGHARREFERLFGDVYEREKRESAMDKGRPTGA